MKETYLSVERLVLLVLLSLYIWQSGLNIRVTNVMPRFLKTVAIFSERSGPENLRTVPSINTAATQLQATKPSPCVPQPYKIHVFSHTPLVIYIENFITRFERDYLIQAADSSFRPSTVRGSDTPDDRPDTVRMSQSASLPFDNTTLCIAQRATDFQGLSVQNLEVVQVVKYGLNDYFKEHVDWFGPSLSVEETYAGDRRSTFFGYLRAANVTGGGTRFPHLRVLDNREGFWCQFIECNNAREESVTFKAIPGNAIYWQNLQDNGTGLREVLHSGTPVKQGEKVGLNLWTRQRRLWEWCDKSPWGMVPANVPCV